MAMFVANNCLITMDGVAVSADANRILIDMKSPLLDATTFGQTARVRKGSLTDASWEVEGFFNNANWSTIQGKQGAASFPISVVPNGGTDGNVAIFCKGISGDYKIGGSVGDMMGFTFSGSSDGPIVGGYLFEATSKTAAATTYTSGIELGALEDGQTLYALAHCTAITDTSPTLDVTVQSADNENFESANDRQSLTQITEVGSEWQTYTTAQTDTWWRFKVVVGGTDPEVTYVLCMQIV